MNHGEKTGNLQVYSMVVLPKNFNDLCEAKKTRQP
jgi:hypothetical protein